MGDPPRKAKQHPVKGAKKRVHAAGLAVGRNFYCGLGRYWGLVI